MVAKGPFIDDVLKPPGTDLHTVFMADMQKLTEAGLQFPGGAGEGSVRLQLAMRGADLLLP